MKHVVVVGAGVAGLSAALDLAGNGARVTVIETGATVGGKMRRLTVGQDEVDSGPTVLTMRWVFDELFADQGVRLEDYVPLRPLDVLARHVFADGTTLDLFADEARSERAVLAFAGAAELERYRAFRSYTKGILAFADGPFIRSEKPTLGALLGHMLGGGIGALTKVDAHRTLWRALGSFFRDPRLRMLYGRYATYCGGSPFECPATLSLISAVEAEGVHVVTGGMHGLALGLERRASELGVAFHTHARVTRIEALHRGHLVHFAEGGEERSVECDAVVLNADAGALARAWVGGVGAGLSPIAPADRSFSAVTFSVVGSTRGRETVEHNVYFGDDYEREMSELTAGRIVPSRPSVYVADQGPSVTAGFRKYFIIVNAAATGDEPQRWSREELERCRRATFETMTRAGMDLTPEAMVVTTPVDFERRFPRTGGALYGARPTSALSFFQRSGARTKTPRIYLAGGSVHPGPGVPMAAASGRFAAKAALEDLGSTVRSRRGGTSGSISTA